MTSISIVGGGLTGVLAAFEAHRLGYSDIQLHERSGRLGGETLPKVDHGVEYREVDIRFGASGDPARDLLEQHGLVFDVVETCCGSVSPSTHGGQVFVEGFDGPALPSRGLALADPGGETLADRIRAYPAEMQAALSRYAQWRLGDWIDTAHGDAAEAMSMARVYPIGGDVSTLDDLRRTDGLYDGLYALPGALVGRPRASSALPQGGVNALFAAARRRLEALGVLINDTSLISPQAALNDCGENRVVVWTADPAPLFGAADIDAPKPPRQARATYVFKAEFGRPAPFHINNFSCDGVVARIFVYESRGQTLLTAQCIAEASDTELRREIQRLTAGFGGEGLVLGDQVHTMVRSGDLPSVEGVRKRADLQHALNRLTGGAMVLADGDLRQPGAFIAASRSMAQALEQIQLSAAAPVALSA